MSDTKTLRVYDGRGDFFIEIPAEAEATFGYFNPAQSETRNKYGGFDGSGPGGQTMRTTALRIYVKDGRTKRQVACFLGVNGFRDETIKLTKINQKVIIETNFEDDEGSGLSQFNSKTQRQITATPEAGSYQ